MNSTSFLKLAIASLALAAAALSTGCASHPGSGPTAEKYDTVQANRQVAVESGVIIQMKRVTIQGTTTGTVAGGGLGGIAATFLSRDAGYLAQTAAASLGALGGSFLGAKATSNKGYQLIIKKTNGQMVSIAQASSAAFKIGQRVFITGDGRVTAE